uniref:Thromboxane A2 receptor n=1 Tax=Sinocyclocheilus anshuiensis TaxID=1608454 RepID=A0A671R3B0_9TELE
YNVLGVAPVRCRENLNTTTNPMAAGLSMTLGIVSNIIALIILAKAYAHLRKRSKATFLLFASSLVATDLAGHVIPGALVLRLYISGTAGGLCNQSDATCHFLGGSMVFFGLCPLFLGCVMAAERCMGVTRPLLHARMVCTAHTKIVLVMIWLLALSVALLPFFHLGTYIYQFPGTWCFINVLDNTSITDVIFVLLFSGLGLAALAMALVCNTISGVTLVIARLRKKKCHQRSAKSHDIEMVAQLVGIMVTSCICWCPLIYFVSRAMNETLMVMGVRLATWNQILDPWVYILLRRAVLKKIYRITTGRSDLKGSTFRRSHRSKENKCCFGLGFNKLVCSCSGLTCTFSFGDSL